MPDGIYLSYSDIDTKKCYIGETIHPPEKRWKQHLSRKNGCPVLGNALRKCGADKFTFVVLIICFDEDRFFYEKEYIKKYNSIVPNGYNVLLGGNDAFTGHTPSEELKKKLAELGKERWKDPEYRAKMIKCIKESNAKIDHSAKILNSEKFKLAMKEGRIGSKGNKTSEVVKQKIRESVTHYYQNNNKSEDTIDKHRKAMTTATGKPVCQYTLENVFVAEYASISEAGRQLKIDKVGIQYCISGRAKSSKGFIWKLKA